MTRTSSIVLPILALLQNAIAFNMPSSRFLTNTFIRMSDIDTPVEEGAFSPSGYQVFLGNLPFAMDENQLGDLVAGKADSMTKMRIAKDKKTGRSRGFAYLDFDSKATAETAVAALAGLQYEGRDLKIDLSEPRTGEARSERPRAVRTPSENSVFVGNLDFGVTEASILDMCEGVLGQGTALKVRIATDRETGRSKGFAHVDFASPDLASRAVTELNGVELMGRSLRIDFAQRKEDRPANADGGMRERSPRSSGGDNQHSIFLGNLAWDVTPELVMDMVNDVLGPGLYNNVRLAIDRETGRQRGFGHIDFKDAETAERAVKELDGLEVMGRQLRADHAQKKESGGFSGGGGRGGGGYGGGRGGGRGGGDRYGGGGGGGAADGSFGSW